MAYIQITDSEIDPESPITTGLMARLRDNPIAMIDGAAGAPRVQTAAIADGAITTAKFGTITNIAVTSDPTTGNHLTRQSYTEGRYLRKDGATAQTVTPPVTFQSTAKYTSAVQLESAGAVLQILDGAGAILSRPDGTAGNQIQWNIVGIGRGTTSSTPALTKRGILGTPTGSTGNMTIPMTRAPASGRTFLVQVTSASSHVSAEYRPGDNEILIAAGSTVLSFDLMVWEVVL